MAEVAVRKVLFADILRLIIGLQAPPVPACGTHGYSRRIATHDPPTT